MVPSLGGVPEKLYRKPIAHEPGRGRGKGTHTTFGHKFDLPLRHMSHSQHDTPGSIDTRSPTLKLVTFDPTSRI